MEISSVKRAILYERITDYALFDNRTLNQVVSDISTLNPDFIFRVFWPFEVTPNSCNQITDPALRSACIKSGSSYENLGNSVRAIRQKVKNAILVGAIPAQKVQAKQAYNPKTNTVISYPATWNMALDPTKWRINKSKISFQCELAKSFQWYPQSSSCSSYNPATVCCYFPDLTNTAYQELLLSWAYREIDMGVDAIWIDLLTAQIMYLYNLVKNLNHPSILATNKAINRIISSIHNYGLSKGKRIYVGTWASIIETGANYNSLDFFTVTPAKSEVSAMAYDEDKWDKILTTIRNKSPNKKIIAFIDYSSGVDSPLGYFSQVLNTAQQIKFMTISRDFFNSKKIVFSYPVHGGWMGNEATKLSFGTRREYDSKAPEFRTYNAIRSLIGIAGSSTRSPYVYLAAGLVAVGLVGGLVLLGS